jgi:hypothetical protein
MPGSTKTMADIQPGTKVLRIGLLVEGSIHFAAFTG